MTTKKKKKKVVKRESGHITQQNNIAEFPVRSPLSKSNPNRCLYVYGVDQARTRHDQTWLYSISSYMGEALIERERGAGQLEDKTEVVG